MNFPSPDDQEPDAREVIARRGEAESKAGRNGFLAILAILIVAVGGCSLLISMAGSDDPPAGSSSSMVDWMASDGHHIASASDALRVAGAAADAGDVAGLRHGCMRLAAAASLAGTGKPIPLASANVHYQAALRDLSEAGSLCFDALDGRIDGAKLRRATVLIGEGGDSLARATAAVEAATP